MEDDASGSDHLVDFEERSPSRGAQDPLVEERRALLRAQCEYWSARAHQTRLECLALERRLGLPPSSHTAALASSLGLGPANGSGSESSNKAADSALGIDHELILQVLESKLAAGPPAIVNGSPVVAINGKANGPSSTQMDSSNISH